MAKRPQDDANAQGAPDVVEQHQRADGAYDEAGVPVDEDGEPLSADEIERRKRGGAFPGPTALDDASDEPLSADMIEQRQVVEYDEEDDRPVD